MEEFGGKSSTDLTPIHMRAKTIALPFSAVSSLFVFALQCSFKSFRFSPNCVTFVATPLDGDMYTLTQQNINKYACAKCIYKLVHKRTKVGETKKWTQTNLVPLGWQQSGCCILFCMFYLAIALLAVRCIAFLPDHALCTSISGST